MKKLYILISSIIAICALMGCTSSIKYKVDGVFTAYEASVSQSAPALTYVSVTIENGKIAAYDIDVRQGQAIENTDSETVSYTYRWNEMTKKELAYGYGMKLYGTKLELVDGVWVEQSGEKPDNEWFEQAELVEEFLLKNSYQDVEEVDGRISNIAGVTIKDSGYVALAAEAVELARAGKFQAVHCLDDDLYIASMYMNARKEMLHLELDMLQGEPNENSFAWAEKTKQQLKEEYGMKGMGSAYEFNNGKWVESSEKTSLEWYEQANLITDYIQSNGWNSNIQAIEGRGATIDGSTLIDDLAGVTMHTQAFYEVLDELFSKVN